MVYNRSNGIDRSIILAIAGSALIGATPNQGSEKSAENPKAQSNAGDGAQAVATQPTNAVKVTQPPVHDRPCQKGSDNRESDLCAQWKAADAASQAAWWAMIATFVTALGTIGLFWQIKLTREAVQDTGEASEAMREANRIAVNSQRAWVTVGAKPQIIRRSGIDGLYIRVDFTAKNIGGSAATDFDFCYTLFFRGQTEQGEEITTKIDHHIAQWRGEYSDMGASNLLPNDTETGSIWDSYQVGDIRWWEGIPVVGKAAQPMLLCAVFYRTVNEPSTIQLSYRSWYINALDGDGQAISLIPFDKIPLGPDDLCVDQFHASLMHSEYSAEGYTSGTEN